MKERKCHSNISGPALRGTVFQSTDKVRREDFSGLKAIWVIKFIFSNDNMPCGLNGMRLKIACLHKYDGDSVIEVDGGKSS